MENFKYYYRALVRAVYDGDTCTMDIDLGLNTWIQGEKFRLNRINAPELTGSEKKEGLKSRDFLQSKINEKEIIIQSIKDKKEKYGRYLAEVWLQDESGSWININDLMVASGHAVFKEY